MVDSASILAAVDLMKRVTGRQGRMLLATAIDQLPDPQTVLRWRKATRWRHRSRRMW